ncbi:PREDICTED: probable cyclic nucleotide-gated ion channel 16 [Ipomoea nil]|uniref:probable cyclic nucleotide-gated ion channel 16 n=1 Tax=Ipomoea nil TaxID=35883 RepID=UPI00090143CA|nr:PREDICTED: probable cyclic nucleotide-gated ion channel 16 [Ipomoea nil]
MDYLRLESTKLVNRFKQSLIYDRQKPWWQQILDPSSDFILRWNHIFLVSSLVGLFIDPLFLLLPRIRKNRCMKVDDRVGYFLIGFRSLADLFSVIQILMKFRTAFVSRTSRVFGKGELVLDKRKIGIRYLKTDFAIDLAATLPLPQILIWFIMPLKKSPTAAHANHAVALVIMLQYVPKLLVIFPLNWKIIKNTGVVAKTAWSGAAYNLLLYLLASHVLGAVWYLMSVERHFSCWKMECKKQGKKCNPLYLDCSYLTMPLRRGWVKHTKVFKHCNAKTTPNDFGFGMFADAYNDQVSSARFYERYFYCLWWGLRSLSSYGQGMDTTTNTVETLFSSIICLMGLVIFALLIGNMQSYLQSMSTRLEEWRIKRRDTEEWMSHRQLPQDLQERVRRFVQYKWLATRGVEEEEILRSLPLDIRREIQRHLCLALVRRVPFFSQMDDQLLDAICERLVSSLNTKDTFIVREGDPVNEMLFIIRGQLESSTTNGGQSGFFNSITLKQGDFCGEELLTWALMPNVNPNLPCSTRTVKSIMEVEAFALRAEDLKFVANQFRRLHSKKLQHAFRYYSHQWRTWGACFMQAAWRRYKRKKMAEELARQESMSYMQFTEEDDDEGKDGSDPAAAGASDTHAQHLSATILASKFAANTRKGVAASQKITMDPADPSLRMPKLFKPNEPDFS